MGSPPRPPPGWPVLDERGPGPAEPALTGDAFGVATTNINEVLVGHVTLEVDIGAPQPAHFTHAQTESIQQGKDGVVGRAAMASPGLIGEGGGGLQQAPRHRGVEQIRQALIGHPTRRRLHGHRAVVIAQK